jgi:hypothetical protein
MRVIGASGDLIKCPMRCVALTALSMNSAAISLAIVAPSQSLRKREQPGGKLDGPCRVGDESLDQSSSKKQQMRWSPGGATCLLQVRTEVLNGDLARQISLVAPAVSQRITLHAMRRLCPFIPHFRDTPILKAKRQRSNSPGINFPPGVFTPSAPSASRSS